MKAKIIIFSILTCLLISSCQKELEEEYNTQEETTSINNEILETNENTNMENIQTAGAQNGDKIAVIKTNTGTIEIKLFTDLVPITTTNFIGLAKTGYYDGIIFHRVIKGFMIQGGDPEGTGMGGESIYGESFEDEFSQYLSNIRYSISMANSGIDTNGSQFFINQNNNNYLDNKHSVFGQVINGADVVDKIAKVKTDSNDKPEKEVKIISIEIKEYQDGLLKDYDFNLEEALKEIEDYKSQIQEAKKSKEVENGDTVSVHYTGTFEDGTKFDSSLDRGEPIEFTVGSGNMISGFDSGVVGMKIGEKKTLTLSPNEAYGERDENNTQTIALSDLQAFIDAGVELKVGNTLPTQYGELEILEVTDSNIVIDANNPMAGKTLIFDIELVDIK